MGRRNTRGHGDAAAAPTGPPLVFLSPSSHVCRGGRSGLWRRRYLRRSISTDAAIRAGIHFEPPGNRRLRAPGDDGLSLVAALSTLFQSGVDALHHPFGTADPGRPSPTDVRRRLQAGYGVSPLARPRSAWPVVEFERRFGVAAAVVRPAGDPALGRPGALVA